MRTGMVLLLVLMGCYTLEAKGTGFKSMAAHFGIQECAASTEKCTAPSQRKWVGLGSTCELCDFATSTYCYDGICDTATKKCTTPTTPPPPPTCAQVAPGGDCDEGGSATATKCCNTDGECDVQTKKCVAYRKSGESCNGGSMDYNVTCNPYSNLYCSNFTGVGVCTVVSYRNVGQSCSTSALLRHNSTCASPLWCNVANGTDGVCANLLDVGATCTDDDQCKGGPSGMAECVGTPKKCTLYRSVADGATPPVSDVKWCKWGLFLDVPNNKCVSSLVCGEDATCKYSDWMRTTNFQLAAVCNPDSVTAGCKSGGKGKCAVLAPNCAGVINDYFADTTNSDSKYNAAVCCIDGAVSSYPTSVKNSCKKAEETPGKSGAASSFLATSVLLVALVAGFFAL